MRIALTVEYRGTAYAGWQIQPEQTTVQGVLEAAIASVEGSRVAVTASGRTDAGVHSLGQTVHFDTESTVPPEKWKVVLNNLLPADISITDSRRVADDFHARADAIDKTYCYRVFVSPVRRAILCDSHDVVAHPLDVAAMRVAAHYLLGQHDFAAFRSQGSTAKTTVRSIAELEIETANVSYDRRGRVAEGEVVLTVTADGFLYNMVRIIAEQLLRVGQGLQPPERIREQLAGKDRAAAREIAPPEGLYLVHVSYPEAKYGPDPDGDDGDALAILD